MAKNAVFPEDAALTCKNNLLSFRRAGFLFFLFEVYGVVLLDCREHDERLCQRYAARTLYLVEQGFESAVIEAVNAIIEKDRRLG